MGEQTLAARWRAWLEKLAPAQGDGTYLIRPWAWSSATYQVDVTTKERWIRLLVALCCIAPAATIAILMIQFDDSLSTLRAALLIYLIWGAVVTARCVGTLVIFRRAQRVPKERWKEPALADPKSQFSRGKEIMFTTMFGVATSIAVMALLSASASGVSTAVQLIVVCGTLFLWSLLRLLWRTARAITMVQIAPLVLVIAWAAANGAARFWPLVTLVILVSGEIFLAVLLRRRRGRQTSS
jgi:hypothetical protein